MTTNAPPSVCCAWPPANLATHSIQKMGHCNVMISIYGASSPHSAACAVTCGASAPTLPLTARDCQLQPLDMASFFAYLPAYAAVGQAAAPAYFAGHLFAARLAPLPGDFYYHFLTSNIVGLRTICAQSSSTAIAGTSHVSVSIRASSPAASPLT